MNYYLSYTKMKFPGGKEEEKWNYRAGLDVWA